MFALGDKIWPGVSKAVEELAELGVVFGKLMGSRGKVEHWSGNLWEMMHDEMGDVLAAVYFVARRNGLDLERIRLRAKQKLAQYKKWHAGELKSL